MYANAKLKAAVIALAISGLGATAALAHGEKPKGGMMQGDTMPMMGMMGMMGEMAKMMENCNKMMQASLDDGESPQAPAHPKKQQQ